MKIVHCTIDIVDCTMDIVNCTMDIVHFTLYCDICTLTVVHYTLGFIFTSIFLFVHYDSILAIITHLDDQKLAFVRFDPCLYGGRPPWQPFCDALSFHLLVYLEKILDISLLKSISLFQSQVNLLLSI